MSYFTKNHPQKNCIEKSRPLEDRDCKEEFITGEAEEAVPMSRNYSSKNPVKGFIRKSQKAPCKRKHQAGYP